LKANLFALAVLAAAVLFCVASYKQNQIALENAQHEARQARMVSDRAVATAREAFRKSSAAEEDSEEDIAECHRRIDHVIVTVETLARSHPGRVRAPVILSMAKR
jgi:hypothetical protein